MPRGGVGLYPSRAVPPEPRRSDFEGHGDLTEAREIITEDVGRRTTGTFPGLERVYRGPNALDDWMEAFRAEWREFNVSLAEVLAENDDAIVVVERLWGRGRESGGGGGDAYRRGLSLQRGGKADPARGLQNRGRGAGRALVAPAIIGTVNDQPTKRPHNPLRRESDMFRVLIMFAVAAAIVIAVALLIGSLAGAIVAAILIGIGLWRTWNLIQEWRRYGSDPAER
jgi:hypothetical protein